MVECASRCPLGELVSEREAARYLPETILPHAPVIQIQLYARVQVSVIFQLFR
jgi:hypothetical protein